MTGTGIEYLVGLFLIGDSLDAPRENVAKILGGVVLVLVAILDISLIH